MEPSSLPVVTLDEQVAALLRLWPEGVAQGSMSRPQLAAQLEEMTRVLEPMPSAMQALKAVQAMLGDSESLLPESLPVALKLAHGRLCDLQLRQLLAALGQEPAAPLPPQLAPTVWPQAESQQDKLDKLYQEDTRPLQPAPRDWWAIPVEGLNGANQIFLLESRELMRGAELCLQALRRDASDYGEQMVLCRAFQAMAVASASMGLRRLASLAQEGQDEFDRLLDEGLPPDTLVLQHTEQRLARIHAELMELVGEPVEEQVIEPATPSEPQVEPGLPAPEVPAQPAPWWWAQDWSVWPQVQAAEPVAATETDSAESDRRAATDVEPEGASESPAPLKLSAAQVQQWADRLAHWQQTGHVDGAQVSALHDEIEAATVVPIESWSVPLFRHLKRAMREAGSAFDFDLEGVGAGASARVLQPLMPLVEAALLERAASGCGPLRLKAVVAADALVLDLVDLGPQPWSAEPSALTPALIQKIASLGGAWQRTPQGWCLRLPQRLSRLPLVLVAAGKARSVLPRLWCQADESFKLAELNEALTQGAIERPDGPWPLFRLSALMKAEQVPVQDSKVLFMAHGPDRLALQVDAVLQVGNALPLTWPDQLAGWRQRCGLWGAAAGSEGALPVIDPFALQRRYGAAARVLSRPRASRAV